LVIINFGLTKVEFGLRVILLTLNNSTALWSSIITNVDVGIL